MYQKCIVNNAWLSLIPVLEKLFKLPKCQYMYFYVDCSTQFAYHLR